MKDRDGDPAKKADGSGKPKFKRTNVDRRSGCDRRESHDIGYFVVGGVERRKKPKDRRELPERRDGWVRVTQWSSLYVGDEMPRPPSARKK